MNKLPLVSIGIPVYNEARFIAQTLDSLLNQDYCNLEIIINDNHSSDDSESICRLYCSKHPHIQYHRFKTNLGPTENFKHVLNLATGEYFMWAAGHDLWSSNYVSSCLELLESHPDAMIAYGTSKWITEEGNTFEKEFGWVDTRGMDTIARYFTILWGNMHPIYGLHRRTELLTHQLSNIVGTDLVLLAQLALKGDFLNASTACWSRREFRTESNYQDKLKRYKSSEYALATSIFDKIAPLSRLPLKLIMGVLEAKIPLHVRLLILFLLLPTLPVRYFSGKRKQ